MKGTICPVKGCKNIRQKRGKDEYKQCCRRHTQMKRILGYNQGEIPKKKNYTKNFIINLVPSRKLWNIKCLQQKHATN